VRLLHPDAFSKLLPWFDPTSVISLKTQPHAVNACVKRSSQRSLIGRIHCSALTVVVQPVSLMYSILIEVICSRVNTTVGTQSVLPLAKQGYTIILENSCIP